MGKQIKKPVVKPLKSFSVLLLYPDYIASNYGEETYYDFVRAKGPKQAIKIAQKRCSELNEFELNDLSDLAVLLVTAGHNRGL